MKKQILPVTVILLIIALFAGCAQNAAAPVADAAISETGDFLTYTGAIILRVNPEILVNYNKEGLVTKIEGLNDDGTAIVGGYADYIGKDCKTVVRDLVEEINEAGYFVKDIDGSSKNITIQIEPGSVLPEEDFLETIAADVRTTVAKMNERTRVVGIGESDYDIRYAAQGSPSGYITRDKAAEIALANAGISAADAVFDDREFDFENGAPVYELEFMSGGREYEYDIDATTGKILRSYLGDSGYDDSYDSYYGDTDYGPGSDGVTDYYAPKPAPSPAQSQASRPAAAPSQASAPSRAPAASTAPSYGATDYGDTDYGPNNDGVTDYGSTNYNDSGYNSSSRNSSSSRSSAGNSNYGSTNYNDSSYGNTNNGDSGYSGGAGYGNSGYSSSDYGNS